MLQLAGNLQIDMAKIMAKNGGLRFAVIGKSGSGKTMTLRLLVQEYIKHGWPLAVIDPMNNFRQLRDAGLPILVAGMQKSADIRVTPANAGHLAEFSFTNRVSVVLDVSMHEVGEDIATIEAFLTPLWRMIRSQDEDQPHQPYALVIDEAHEYIPQNGMTDVTPILVDMSKRGRQLNLSMFYATQRPQAISKEMLYQANAFVAHKVAGGDIEVVAKNISQPRNIVAPINKKLIAGQAIVAGDAGVVDTGDEDYLVTQIYEWGASSNERQLATVASGTMQPINPDMIASLRSAMESDQAEDDHDPDLVTRLKSRIHYLEVELERMKMSQQMALPLPIPSVVPVITPVSPVIRSQEAASAAPANGKQSLNSGSCRILSKLADIYPMRVSRKQIATLTGYTESGGTFNGNWGSLKRENLVQEGEKFVAITTAGFAHLNRQPRVIPQTTEALMFMWREVLKDREYDILKFLVECYPRSFSVVEMADACGMTATGGAFNGYIGTLRQNGLIVKEDGLLIANADSLMLLQKG